MKKKKELTQKQLEDAAKLDGETMVPPQEPEKQETDPQAIIEQILKNVGAQPAGPIDPCVAAINFVMTASGNLEIYSSWTGTSAQTKKRFVKLFALIHSGKLVDMNAQEILELAQRVKMQNFGMELINKSYQVLHEVNSQPAILPLEVLAQSLIHKG